MRRFTPFAFAILLATFFAPPAGAADDDNVYPVAVRWWGQAMISIENWWGLTVVIDPYSLEIGYNDPGVDADFVCVSHEHFDHNNVGLIAGDPFVIRGLENGAVESFATTTEDRADGASRHTTHIDTIASFHDDKRGADLGANAMFLVETEGVRILHCGDLGQHALTKEQLEQIGEIDVLCVPVGGVYTVDGPQAVAIVEQIHPRIVVPIHYKTRALTISLDPVEPFLAALPDKYEVVRPVGNTLAVSAGGGPTRENPRVVVLNYRPWEMPAGLADLFGAKEAASKKSQETFRALRTDQLNHKPSNGTHTPRWNSEHMLGTESLFFSSMYARLDPAIRPINLRPAQMPPDYVAAHPDWDGEQEADQMQRVEDFSRRFAYLLDGAPLDELPEGAPRFAGDLRGLFNLMINHYGEHTAHVHEKYELEDWPE